MIVHSVGRLHSDASSGSGNRRYEVTYLRSRSGVVVKVEHVIG
jgi:hypothetical protein